jgi:dihydrofolate reductase
MRLSLIAAVAANGVIGHNNRIPWRLPADLRWFKSVTLGSPIIMGRKTYESIGKPLPGRHNIVVTRDVTYQAPGCTVVHSLAEALTAADGADEVFIIGGAELYAQTLPIADRFYLTEVDAAVAGDTFFPAWDRSQWRELARESHAADDKNPYAYTFVTLARQAGRSEAD